MINKAQSWLIILSAIGALAVWAVTMYGLPPRVSKLEMRIEDLERKFVSTEVKQSMILDTVVRIETFILQRHAGGQ